MTREEQDRLDATISGLAEITLDLGLSEAEVGELLRRRIRETQDADALDTEERRRRDIAFLAEAASGIRRPMTDDRRPPSPEERDRFADELEAEDYRAARKTAPFSMELSGTWEAPPPTEEQVKAIIALAPLLMRPRPGSTAWHVEVEQHWHAIILAGRRTSNPAARR